MEYVSLSVNFVYRKTRNVGENTNIGEKKGEIYLKTGLHNSLRAIHFRDFLCIKVLINC
jgi:hypothetical protein